MQHSLIDVFCDDDGIHEISDALPEYESVERGESLGHGLWVGGGGGGDVVNAGAGVKTEFI